MKKTLFGTDGIRGRVNLYPINAYIILKFGIAIGLYFRKKLLQISHNNGQKQLLRAVIAKDTRLSGYMIEQALTSGLISMGIDVILVGPMPTAAVPVLVHSLRADFGVMITASHNPHHDNGIKLFDEHGLKMKDEAQKTIYELMEYCDNALTNGDFQSLLVSAEELGKARRLEDAIGRYIEYIKGAYSRERKLSKFRIVIDCANGSAYKVAPSIFWELGAEVISIHNEPDGLNINANCGSTAPEELSKKVLEYQANIGFAFDGDADRVVVCDEKGQIIHGDMLIGFIASHLAMSNKLKNNCIIVTESSNNALTRYMNSLGIKVITTRTGDRYVAEEMQNHRSNFGGETSGHIIMGDYLYTGDGILAALYVINAIAEKKVNVSEAFSLFTLNPFIQEYISFHDISPLSSTKNKDLIDNIIRSKPHMKVMVRESGTEKKIRILIEGHDKKEVEEVASNIKNIIKSNRDEIL